MGFLSSPVMDGFSPVNNKMKGLLTLPFPFYSFHPQSPPLFPFKVLSYA